MIINFDLYQTLAIAVVLLIVGEWLKNKINILEKFCIPTPVIGGVIFSIITLLGHISGAFEFQMDFSLRSLFMISFFTTVGFTASLKLLKKGGIQVLIFLLLSVILVILQDILGISLAKVFHLNPLIGLSTGSVSMTGGHGTSGAFAPIFVADGAKGAMSVAMASATFGLIFGSLIGGPIGEKLIKKNNLSSKEPSKKEKDSKYEKNNTKILLDENKISRATFLIIIAMGVGTLISKYLQSTGLSFPVYIGSMFVAAILRNFGDLKLFKVDEKEISIIGNISLSLFLSQALMGLKLWQLSSLALPLIVMLFSQVLLMGIFAYFITFKIMGKDYDAAVMACGQCGFGMGATPNAMANMSALTKRYSYSFKAFFILPLVGSLFIDFINASVITIFFNIFK